MTDEPKSWGQQEVSLRDILVWSLGLLFVIGFVVALVTPRSSSGTSSTAMSAEPTVYCDQYNVCTPSNASSHMKLCNQIMSNGRAFVAAQKYDLAIQSAALAGQMECDYSGQ